MKRNLEQALKLRSHAGDRRADYELAMHFVSSSPEKKVKEILKLLKKASNEGVIEATYYLGIASLEEWNPKKSKALALKYIQKAAASGLPEACNRLAVKYEGGVEAPKNLKLATYWYKKGATLGDPLAQFNLATNYENGIGVRKSLKEALKWYRAASVQNYDEAFEKVRELESKMAKKWPKLSKNSKNTAKNAALIKGRK